MEERSEERFVSLTLARGYTSPTAASRFKITCTSVIFIGRAYHQTELFCVPQRAVPVSLLISDC